MIIKFAYIANEYVSNNISMLVLHADLASEMFMYQNQGLLIGFQQQNMSLISMWRWAGEPEYLPSILLQ